MGCVNTLKWIATLKYLRMHSLDEKNAKMIQCAIYYWMSNTFIFHGLANSNIIIAAPCTLHAHFLATDFHHRRETKVQRRLHKARACTWTCACACIGFCSCKCARESCERRVQQLKRPRRHHQGNSYFSNVRLYTWVFH